MDGATLKDNRESQRFELIVDTRLIGFAQYSISGNTVNIFHTEISPEYEGRGYGSELARLALDQIRAQQMKLVPACRFIASYVQRHQEYADLVKS